MDRTILVQVIENGVSLQVAFADIWIIELCSANSTIE